MCSKGDLPMRVSSNNFRAQRTEISKLNEMSYQDGSMKHRDQEAKEIGKDHYQRTYVS